MTDVLLYWRDFRRNLSARADEIRLWRWHSKASLLAGLEPGDRLWMVTSGKNLGLDAEQAGFLVAMWRVERSELNAGDDPAYPSDNYRYRVTADPTGSLTIDPPVLVDHIVRPLGRDKAVGIGRFLQGPRKLSDEKLRLLKAAAGPDLALKWLTGK
jgi:hypothetical protein